MDQVDVVAVVGSCAPERRRYAHRHSQETRAMLIAAERIALSPAPVDEALALAPWGALVGGAVIEFPSTVSMIELIGALAAEDARTRLTEVVCVVDAFHLLADLARDSYARQPRPLERPEAGQRYTAHAMLTVTQIEFASTILLVNWEPLPTDELSTVMSLVSHLSPRARLRLEHADSAPVLPGRPYAIGQDRPGWVGLLNDDFAPHMADPRVAGMRWEHLRPLHPERLERLLDDRVEPGEFGTVIRSAGFCRLATRPHVVGRWDHVGRMISFEPLAVDGALRDGDELLAFGQDLAFIGLDLDRAALAEALEGAVLTDDELAAGPTAWSGFHDPFPAWVTADDLAD